MRLRFILFLLILTAWAATAFSQVPPDVAASVAASLSTIESKPIAKPTPAPLPIPTLPPLKPLWRDPPHRVATVWGSQTCLPCKAMVPSIDALAQEGWAIEYAKTEDEPSAAVTWNIDATPQVIIHDHGPATGRIEVGRRRGFLDLGALRELLRAQKVHRVQTTAPQPGAAPVPVAQGPALEGTPGPVLYSGGCAGGSCGTRVRGGWRGR